MTPLAKRIKEAREAAGLTQADVALQCDPPLTPQAIYKWERGTGRPSARNLDMLVRLTGRSLKWFLYGVENIPNEVNLSDGETIGRVVPSVENNNILNHLGSEPAVTKKYVRTNFPCSERAFHTTIVDDANAPDLQIGDSVVIDPERKPRPGKFCLALYQGEPVIRRYRPRNDHVELAPVNGDWPTIEVAPDAILGAITEITHPH